jgi:hypothetical protein
MSGKIPSAFDEQFDDAGRIVRESRSFVAIRRLAGVADRLLEGSRLVAAARARTREFVQLVAPVRLRIVGVVLLSAAITNAVLLLFVPRQMAPAPPFAVPIVAGLGAVLLIVRSSR